MNSINHGNIFPISHLFYKQLALRWQISKELSGRNPLSLSDNKNYRLTKSGVLSL